MTCNSHPILFNYSTALRRRRGTWSGAARAAITKTVQGRSRKTGTVLTPRRVQSLCSSLRSCAGLRRHRHSYISVHAITHAGKHRYCHICRTNLHDPCRNTCAVGCIYHPGSLKSTRLRSAVLLVSFFFSPLWVFDS